MDAMTRAARQPFAKAVRSNLYEIEPGAVHSQLDGLDLNDWLPPKPELRVWVRHTVGLGDPLTQADIPAGERLDDGFPQSLEDYVEQTGIRFFKIKVSNQLDHDLGRLKTIAALVERHRGEDYHLTLDGNEQYKSADAFDRLIDAIEGSDDLQTLWNNTLVVEQPLDRKIALDEQHTGGIRSLSQRTPVIIDESDGTVDSYVQAIELGYRGVSSKNCKGPVKSLLNAGLTWLCNDRGRQSGFVMTGEDLCSVGIIPVQSDLCLTATLGLTHVERNGHHFHPGLSYLTADQQEAALSAHPDFYARHNDIVSPRLVDGRFEIGSLQCVGFGFSVEPDFQSMQSADEWEFSSLDLA